MKEKEQNGGANVSQDAFGVSMKTIRRPTAARLWAAGAVWLVWLLVLPLYKPFHFIVCAVVSFLVGLLAAKYFPDGTRQVEVPFTTGDSSLDGAISELRRTADALSSIRKLLSEKNTGTENCSSMENVCSEIEERLKTLARRMRELGTYPQGLRRFINYYIPTTIKLANKYLSLLPEKNRVESVSTTLWDIEKVLDKLPEALDKQLEALYAGETMDISTDIEVMEALLHRDGLE